MSEHPVYPAVGCRGLRADHAVPLELQRSRARGSESWIEVGPGEEPSVFLSHFRQVRVCQSAIRSTEVVSPTAILWRVNFRPGRPV